MNSPECRVVESLPLMEKVNPNETQFEREMEFFDNNQNCAEYNSRQCCVCPDNLIYSASSVSVLNHENGFFQPRMPKKELGQFKNEKDAILFMATNHVPMQEGAQIVVPQEKNVNNAKVASRKVDLNMGKSPIDLKSRINLKTTCAPKELYSNSSKSSYSEESSANEHFETPGKIDDNEEIFECNLCPSEFYSKYIYPFCSERDSPSEVLEKYTHLRNSGKRVDIKESSESTLFDVSQKIDYFLNECELSDYNPAYELSRDGLSLKKKTFKNVSVSTSETIQAPTNAVTGRTLFDKYSFGDSGFNQPFLKDKEGGDSKTLLSENVLSYRLRDDGIAIQEGVLPSHEVSTNSVIKFEKRYYVVYNKENNQPKPFWRSLKNLCIFRFFRNFMSSKNIS